MRLAITGAGGRLGSALNRMLAHAPEDATDQVLAWTRAELDLDDPDPVAARVEAARPDVVIHAAAWTDVDGCAREPDLAMRRNGHATAVLARACARAGASLVVISTNEVFDGERVDGRGYTPEDPVRPANAYGRSKLAGEVGALEVYSALGGPSAPWLAIVRTAWLFGFGKPDFPSKIVAAARSAVEERRALRLVTDEVGTPTYVPDLADAVLRLTGTEASGVHHIVNEGRASRAEWAREVLDRVGIDVAIEEISLRDHPRPSRPPRWGVLEPTAIPGSGPLRHWREALAERLRASETAR